MDTSRADGATSRPFRLRRFSRRCIFAGLALLASLLTPTAAPDAAAQGFMPIACDGTPYIMQNSRMFEVLPDPANPGQFLLNEVGAPGVVYGNSLGFDPTTNLIYGTRKIAGAWQVETYDATFGMVRRLPIVAAAGSPDWPQTSSNYAGTVLGDGRYMVTTFSTVDQLWIINPATGEATLVGPVSPRNPRLADFAYNPADGYMYHAVSGALWRIDPNTGIKTSLGAVAGLPSGFGSSYFDAAGNLYVHKNSDGRLYQISGIGTGTHTQTLVATTPSVRGADAASCVGELDLLKDVVDAAGDPVPLDERTYAPGDTVRYEFTIINNALPAGPQDLNLCDVLPADGRSYTGAFSSAAPVSFSPPLAAGDTSFCATVTAPSSLWIDPLQPGGDPVKLIVEVELGPDMLPGEYANQATLESPFRPGDPVISDDPGDLSDPEDPTTIEVTGEFRVSKTVATHPDGNDTDSFTVTISCVDVDGLPFDVDASSIVDMLGAPWPTAATNEAMIRHGETFRVIDLPSGAVCTSVETVPPAYAASSVSGDDLAPGGVGGVITIDEKPSDETIALTNRTGQFSLTKFTHLTKGAAAPVDPTGSFTIQVTCTGADGNQVLPPTNYTIDASTPTADGATGTLAYPDTPLLPEGSTCTATELAATGWTDLTGTVTFTISPKEPAGAEFHNEIDLTGLSVTKSITGLEDDEDPAGFMFDVTIRCSGGFVAATETFGPFTLGTTIPVVLNGVPAGSTCTAVEAPTAAFAPVYTPAGGVVTVESDGSDIHIENVTGTFAIQKDTVIATNDYGVDPTGSFDFSVVCVHAGSTIVDSTYAVAATDTSPDTGATGGITYGDLPILPPGTVCTVTEIVPAGWQLSSAPSITIEIPADGIRPTASFTNTRTLGDLTIDKTVEGLPFGYDAETLIFSMTATCEGPFIDSPIVLTGTVTNGNDLVFEDLPVGTDCKVEEAADVRFITADPVQSGAIADDEGALVEFVNTTSFFALTKTTVVPSKLPIDPDGSFDVAIVCWTDGVQVVDTTVTLTTSSGTATLTPPAFPIVAPGSTCTLTETPGSHWTATTNTQDITIGEAPSTIVFENTRKVADLTVTKTIEGLPDGLDPSDYAFTVDVECTGDFLPAGTWSIDNLPISTDNDLVIQNLPTGATCVVTEDTAPSFVATYPDGQKVEIDEKGAALSITNTTSSFEIVKTTVVPDGVEDDGSFGFSWTCDNPTASSGTMTLVTSGGAGTLTAADGLPLVEPGTTCTVIESTVPAGWTVSPATFDVTTSPEEPAGAAFVNTRVVEDLTITKSILGLPDDEDPLDHTFLVDISCTGDFEPGPLTLTDVPITIDGPITIPDLPTGALCTVVEQPDPAWSPTYSPATGTVTIAEGGANGIGIVNSTGELIVFKETLVEDTHPIDPHGAFDFQITCTAPTGIVSYDSIVTLTTETLTATGAAGGITYESLGVLFAAGTVCEITELDPPTGWTLDSDKTVKIVVSVDGPRTASFSNSRDLGQVDVMKTIDGLPADLDEGDFDFLVTFTCNGGGLPTDYEVGPVVITAGGSVTVDDLPTGAICSVVETADNRFTPAYDVDEVTVGADPVAVRITNTTRTLAITKAATASGDHQIRLAQTFTFSINCSNGYAQNVSITTDASGAGSIAHPALPLLAAGTTCTVTETDLPAGWGVVGSPSRTITLDADQTVAFSNTRGVADLRVNKTVTGLPTPFDPADFSFTVDVECNGDFVGGTLSLVDQPISTAGSLVIEDLPTGAVCTITEDPATGFATSYPAGQTTEITHDPTVLAIDNATSTFAISKTTSAPDGVIDDDTFTFSWSCNDVNASSGTSTITTVDGSGTFVHTMGLPLLPPETSCVIDETPLPTGWTVAVSPRSVTTNTTAPITAAFHNTRDVGSLVLTKIIVGEDATDDLLDEEFRVTVTCTGDFDTSPFVEVVTVSQAAAAAIDDLPTGAVCTIEEAADFRFTPTYSPETLTIESGANTSTITNRTGRFIVAKDAIVPTDLPVTPFADFEFQIVCTNSGVEVYRQVHVLSTDTATVTGATGGIGYDELPLLADGTTCLITEIPAPGWTLLTDPNPIELTIDSTAPQTAAFTNRRDVAPLVIEKRIEGLPAELDPTDFRFPVTVVCDGGGLPADHEVGVYTIATDEPIVIGGLPTGAICSIDEAMDMRFAAIEPEPLTIGTDLNAALIINRTSSLALDKTVVVPDGSEIAVVHEFEFTVVCDNGAEFVTTLTTDAIGVASASHVDGLPLVPPGSRCTVRETPDAAWTVSPAEPVEIVTSTETVAKASIINTRAVTSLVIDKTVAGLPTDHPGGQVWGIVIDCVGDFVDGERTFNATVSDGSTITLDDLPTGARCVVTERPSAGFSPTLEPADGAVTLTDAPASVSITNATSTFAITKSTFSSRGVQDGTFTFVWSCDDPLMSSGVATITTVGSTGAFDWSDGLPLLEPGTVCIVEETDIPVNWQTTEPTVTVTTNATGNVDAEFLNLRTTAELVISKTILGLDDGDNPDDYEFTVDITCSGDFPDSPLILLDQPIRTDAWITVAVPTGAECTAVEDPDPAFAAIYGPQGRAAFVTEFGGAISLVNLTGRVQLVKQTLLNPRSSQSPVGAFFFDIECVGLDGATLVDRVITVETTEITATGAVGAPTDLPLLADGTECLITELDARDGAPGAPQGWLLNSTNDQTITVRSEPGGAAVFENERLEWFFGLPSDTDSLDTGDPSEDVEPPTIAETDPTEQTSPFDDDLPTGPLAYTGASTRLLALLGTLLILGGHTLLALEQRVRRRECD